MHSTDELTLDQENKIIAIAKGMTIKERDCILKDPWHYILHDSLGSTWPKLTAAGLNTDSIDVWVCLIESLKYD